MISTRLNKNHILVGCVGALMAGSGLAEVLETVFGGVKKMLIGKKFPQNIRAMRMLTEELLRGLLENNNTLTCNDDLIKLLDSVSTLSPTTKLWVDGLIKPVLIMMLFVRAEREADWSLHLKAVEMMLPYFFAAKHVNYARYGLVYLIQMQRLPDVIVTRFLKGEHVTRHIPGLWNGLWSDMFIETSFMKYGKSKYGIVGITLKPSTLKTWALSLHVCGQLVNDIVLLRDNEVGNIQITHKEEYPARIKSDSLDREGLRKKLIQIINPLDPQMHNGKLLNIITGQIADTSVNVADLLKIGSETMIDFNSKLPHGFYNPISPKSVFMSVKVKSIQIGDKKIFNPSLIYARAMGVQTSGRDISVNDIMSHELSPYPLAIFTEKGDMKIAKSKSVLKNSTKVEVSSRQYNFDSKPNIFIDGCALLWVIRWPSGTTILPALVSDFVIKFKNKLASIVDRGNVFLVFDRYFDFSPKSFTRSARGASSRVHQLEIGTTLPPQTVTLSVTANKIQLIDIICDEIVNDSTYCAHLKNNLMITASRVSPIEVSHGVVTERADLSTNHEEGDIIVVQQAIRASKETANPDPVIVIADDTDIYILLLHFYLSEELDIPMVMESPLLEKTSVDIRASVEKNKEIIPFLLAAHALTGADTCACYHGIGKGKMIATLKSGLKLTNVGDKSATFESVINEATTFISTQKCSKDMTETRINVWKTKMGKTSRSAVSAPALNTLPPTREAFAENVKRAHLQAILWMSSLCQEAPDLDPRNFGWSRDEPNKSLIPTTVPSSVKLAPDTILQMISCGCTSKNPCRLTDVVVKIAISAVQYFVNVRETLPVVTF